jgi:hypothetical protein
MIALYTDYDLKFFENRNRDLIEQGLIVPYSPEIEEIQRINAVTDEELEKALNKKFFAVKALLDRFTSPIPVDRMLKMAKRMNKTIGIINAIEARLSELQEEEYSSEVD